MRSAVLPFGQLVKSETQTFTKKSHFPIFKLIIVILFQVPILLVGNKVDLEHQREVPTVEGMVSVFFGNKCYQFI